MSRSALPFDLQIASPCTQSWDEMSGSLTQRHCASCNKQVHNLAALTPSQIERLVIEAGGNLCARLTRREDGSLITSDRQGPLFPRAAGFVLATALVSSAQGNSQTQLQQAAIVTGKVLSPDGKTPMPAEIIFIANHEEVLKTKADSQGNWRASLAPGQYDVVFRQNVLFGARVNGVQIHAGEQAFAPVRDTFAYGRLGVEDNNTQTSTTMGELVSTYRYPISYLFRHPIRYIKHLPHNFT